MWLFCGACFNSSHTRQVRQIRFTLNVHITFELVAFLDKREVKIFSASHPERLPSFSISSSFALFFVSLLSFFFSKRKKKEVCCLSYCLFSWKSNWQTSLFFSKIWINTINFQTCCWHFRLLSVFKSFLWEKIEIHVKERFGIGCLHSDITFPVSFLFDCVFSWWSFSCNVWQLLPWSKKKKKKKRPLGLCIKSEHCSHHGILN